MSRKRERRPSLLAPIAVAIALVGGIFWGRNIERVALNGDIRSIIKSIPQRPGQSNKISSTLDLIEQRYLDEISFDSLSEKIIPEIVAQLDPHSAYIPAEQMQRVNEPLEGEFDGIGVVFNMSTDTVIILNVISNGPSDKAGIVGRDRIITINDSIVAGRKVSQDSIMRQLRGTRGTKVKLGIERSGLSELLDIEVTRDKIPLHSVESAFMITDKVAFIRLSQFSRTTHREIKEHLLRLKAKGMESLILDLRNNAGGYLDQAINLSNEFLAANNLIVYTEDRAGKQQKEYSNGKGAYQELPLVVLIDEGSASSSEIFAGAIQDNDRGTIIGRRSFGKGLVQEQIPYSDGSAIRLTIARYYTPTGRSIQKPYSLGEGDSYQEDIINRINNQELFHADSIHFVDSLRKVTPGGKSVYGGGGIMPDVFIPVDTLNITPYYTKVMNRNILFRFTTEYADKHSAELNAVKSVEELKALLDSDKELVDEFIRYASRKGVRPSWGNIHTSRTLIEAQLRAYIGRSTPLGDDGFFINIYPIDNILQRGVEELTINE
ncbi:MAG: S41 family peptidase [Rikenellaceae bacterium]